jgi:hypothetical protein
VCVSLLKKVLECKLWEADSPCVNTLSVVLCVLLIFACVISS